MDARFSRPMEAWSRCSPAEQVTTDSYASAISSGSREVAESLVLQVVEFGPY